MNIEKVKQWIGEGNIEAVENAWMEAMEGSPPLGQMREALAALVAAGRDESAQTLSGLTLSEAVDHRSAEQALEVARTLLPVLPATQDLRVTAADLYRKAYGQAEHFGAFMDASGLLAAQSLRRAMQTLDICLAAAAGVYLVNRFEQQVARVEKYDELMGQFELSGPGGRKVHLEPKLLADDFEPVADSDFRVLCQFRMEEVGKLLRGDIEAVLIGICLSHGGRIDATGLKDLLVPKYLDKEAWGDWWSKARSAARRSQKLTLEGRNPAALTYHPGGRTLEEEMADVAAKARMPMDRLAVLQQYLREVSHRKLQADAAFVGPLMEALAEQARTFGDRRPVDALAASLAIDVTVAMGLPAPRGPHPTAAQVLASSDDPAAAVARLAEPALWPAAYQALAQRPDALDQFQRLLALLPADQLDEVASRLRAAGRGQAVEEAATQAMADPVGRMQVLLWLWLGPAEPLTQAPSPLEMLSRLLNVLQELGRDWQADRQERKEAFQQIRSAMTAFQCRRFREAAAQMDPSVAETIKRRLELVPGLSDVSRDELLAALREKFYSLFMKAKVEPWMDENTLWATEASLHRKEAELKELMEVKIPANSKAIGDAAKLGDLSENSEWQFAIEEMRMLKARVSQIQNELSRARALHHGDVPADTVGIGSRVTLRRLGDGQTVELSFLGSWDSNVQQKVYSYQTPLALSLMGKALGETVRLKLDGPEEDYLIERLASAV